MENKEFYIDKDGFKIHAKLQFPKEQQEKMPLVILAHGLTGHMDEDHIIGVADAVLDAGYICLRMEQYGHGKTDGDFYHHNLYEWVSEIAYVVDYAKALPYVSDVILAGHSQGGLSTILVAGIKRNQLKAIIPLSPANNIPVACREGNFFGTPFDADNVPDHLQFWEDKALSGNYIRIGQTIDYISAIKAYHGPVLLIHGDADDAVPYFYSTEALNLYDNARLVTLENDGHCYEKHLDQAKEAVTAFLRELK